jgi:UDP:flavonoid glycosyltransferase YjiC (YdhE family)
MRILICWELGAGMGHVRRLAPVVSGLTGRGHQVVIAARDVVSALSALDDERIPIVAAPVSMRCSPKLPPSASYPEVLLRVGYADAEILNGLLSAWRHLFNMVGAEAVIAEHAPTALLAAKMVGMPSAAVGTGFSVPPCIAPMPGLVNYQKAPAERLRAAERRVIGNVQRAVGHSGRSAIENVAELFRPERSFVCSYPEFDHHGARPGVRYWGAIEPLDTPGEDPEWPTGDKPPVFVYLHHNYKAFSGLVQQLKTAGYPTLLVSPGIPEDLAREISSPAIRIARRPVDLAKVAERRCVVITHCGHGTTARLLLLGVPMILLPNYVEQTVLAYRLAQQRLALMMNPDPRRHRYAAAIERLLADEGYRERAGAFAARHAQPAVEVRLEALLDDLGRCVEPR